MVIGFEARWMVECAPRMLEDELGRNNLHFSQRTREWGTRL
jgi:hypothetical protein